MPAPEPYLHFPARPRTRWPFTTASSAVNLSSAPTAASTAATGRPTPWPHGILHGLVSLFAADAAPGEDTFQSSGLTFSLLGMSDPATLGTWFDQLTD